MCDDIEYEYTYTLTQERILSESLYYYPNQKRAKIFDRQNNEITFGSKVITRPKEVADSLTPKNLFLSRASAMNRPLAQRIYKFFMHEFMLDLVPIQGDQIEYFFKKYKQLILNAMTCCDSDIVDIILKKRPQIYKKMPIKQSLQTTPDSGSQETEDRSATSSGNAAFRNCHHTYRSWRAWYLPDRRPAFRG